MKGIAKRKSVMAMGGETFKVKAKDVTFKRYVLSENGKPIANDGKLKRLRLKLSGLRAAAVAKKSSAIYAITDLWAKPDEDEEV